MFVARSAPFLGLTGFINFCGCTAVRCLFNKAFYLYECNLYDIPFDQVECDHLYRSAKNHDKDEDKEELEVPLRMSIGVTAALCGYFLRFVPHPNCQTASAFLIGIGLEMCIDSTISRVEEKWKRSKR